MIPKLKEIKLPLKAEDERISEYKQYLVYDKGSKTWDIATSSIQWFGWSFNIGWTTGQWDDFGKEKGYTYSKMFELPGKCVAED